MVADGYLSDTGWTLTVRRGLPVDARGQPVPWVTLPFIDFITARLAPSSRVFEYGCGNSTLFYAPRVAHVDAVEHETEWFSRMQSQAPANVTIECVPLDLGGLYARHAENRQGGYDLIVVDGRDRVNCVRSAIRAVNSRGCIVLDDSERPEYAEGVGALHASGFRQLDFWGIAPGLSYRKCTSVFYRNDNALEI